MRSSDNSSGKWLHKSTLPCLIWLFWRAQSQIGMCVAFLTQHLAVSLVFSPVQFGLPVFRQRRYTFGINLETCVLSSCLSSLFSEGMPELPQPSCSQHDWSEGDHHSLREFLEKRLQTAFLEMFSHSRTADSSVFLQASESMVEAYCRELASARGVASDLLGADMTVLLSGARFQRPVGYRRLIRDVASPETCYIVDLEQTSGYMNHVSTTVPALLQRSVRGSSAGAGGFCFSCPDLHARRLLEHFAIQGYPLICRPGVHKTLRSYFAWDVEWLVKTFSSRQLRHYTGMGCMCSPLGSSGRGACD